MVNLEAYQIVLLPKKLAHTDCHVTVQYKVLDHGVFCSVTTQLKFLTVTWLFLLF